MLFQGRSVQRLEVVFFLLTVFFLDLDDLLTKRIRLELFGQADFKVADQPVEAFGKAGGMAGLHRQGPGTIFILEIVDHAPVRRRGQGFGRLMDDLLHDGGFAGAFRTGDEDVVSGAFHLQPEGDGPHRPLLADHLVQRFDVGGGFKIEHGRVAQTAQVGELYFVFERS